MDLVRNIGSAQDASKLLVDHALSRFSTDNLSCMVVRFDEDRLKEIIRGEPIGVDGDTHVPNGVSETDKILEAARKSMALAGIGDDPESVAEETKKKMVQKMVEEEPGPELAVDEKETVKPDVDEEK